MERVPFNFYRLGFRIYKHRENYVKGFDFCIVTMGYQQLNQISETAHLNELSGNGRRFILCSNIRWCKFHANAECQIPIYTVTVFNEWPREGFISISGLKYSHNKRVILAERLRERLNVQWLIAPRDILIVTEWNGNLIQLRLIEFEETVPNSRQWHNWTQLQVNMPFANTSRPWDIHVQFVISWWDDPTKFGPKRHVCHICPWLPRAVPLCHFVGKVLIYSTTSS